MFPARVLGEKMHVKQEKMLSCKDSLYNFSVAQLGRGVLVQGAAVDYGERIAYRQCGVDVVRREEYALALVVRQFSEQTTDFEAVGYVEKGGRFVENDCRRLLCKGAGNHYALALAVGQGVDGALGECLHTHGAQGVGDYGAVERLHTPYPVGVWRATDGDYVFATKVGDADFVGADKGDDAGKGVGRERGGIAIVEHYFAFARSLGGDYGTQKGTFTCTVTTYEGAEFAFAKFGRGIGDKRAGAVGERYVAECNHRKRLRLRVTM